MRDRILGAVCVIVAGCMGWNARGYVAPISYEPVGPRAFPMLLAALMALFGLWLVVRPQRATATAGAPSAGDEAGFTLWRVVGLAALAIVVYALLFETLGFSVATALMAVPVGVAFGGRWWKCLIVGVGLGLGLFLLFDRALDVVLPAGWLSFLFG